MNKEKFVEYVASFHPDYAPSGKDFIEQAKKITRESQKRGRYE